MTMGQALQKKLIAAGIALLWIPIGTAQSPGIDWETDPNRMPDRAYVQIKDGHLYLDGERVRYWGHIGHFPNPSLKVDRTPDTARRDLALIVERMKDPGFNMHRLWYLPTETFEKCVLFDRTGVRLFAVEVVNHEDMPYPGTPEERYIAFSLNSVEGKPLHQTSRATLYLVSRSFNPGYRLDMEGEPQEFFGPGIAEAGSLPVRVARVAGTVESEAIDGIVYTMFDYEMNEIGRGRVRNGRIEVPAGKAGVLHRTASRGWAG